MNLGKVNWRKINGSWLCIGGTINRNRVIFIHQVYKNRFGIVFNLTNLPTHTEYIDTYDLKVVKKEAIRLLTEYLNKVNDEIKLLTA